MSKKHLKKGRVLMTYVLTVGIIIAADCIRRDFFIKPDTTLVISGSFRDPQTPAQTPGSDAAVMASTQPSSQGISYLGYSEFAVPASQLSSGLLTIINDQHPSTSAEAANSLVSLSETKNEFYSLYTDNIMLNSDAADALNLMMLDYNAATGLSDFVVYSTTQPDTSADSPCPNSFAESASGLTIDLAVQGTNRLLEYDGLDEEGWIVANCSNYGFAVRYPEGKEAATGQSGCVWHLRYVGKVHAAVMEQNNLSMEEYIEWIKPYTIDTAPLTVEIDGVQYEVYYTPSMGDTTSVRVPVSGNYTISGNNIDGFIVDAAK